VRALKATLAQPGAPLARALPSAAPGLIAMRRPVDILRGIQLARLILPPPTTDESTTDGAWAKVVADASTVSTGLLWYVRRRNVDYRSDVVGIPVRVTMNDTEIETDVMNTMRTLGLDARVNALRGSTTTLAISELMTLLGSRKFTESPLLANAVVHELESAAASTDAPQPLDRAAILKVAERFADPQIGEGLKRLEQARPELDTDPTILEALVESEKVAELDRIGRTLRDAQLLAFTRALQEAAAGGAERIDDVIASATPANP
jgi:hypothetical protein